ncbi:hypothetical protein GCM10009414_28480 [Tatumella terrea]
MAIKTKANDGTPQLTYLSSASDGVNVNIDNVDIIIVTNSEDLSLEISYAAMPKTNSIIIGLDAPDM